MKPINPNSIAYFMGFNATKKGISKNPFSLLTQEKAAKDWLRGFNDAQEQRMQANGR